MFAATLVMIYHFGFWNWQTGQPLVLAFPGQAPVWGTNLHFGWVGVEIFFVISGFVIAYTTSYARPSSFLRSRFLRLAPASWIGATLVLAIHLAIGTPDTLGLLTRYGETLVFWPLNAIDGVWWTLGIEIDFYFIAYFLIKQGRSAALEPLMVVVGALSGVFWIAALTLQLVLQGHEGYLGTLYGACLEGAGEPRATTPSCSAWIALCAWGGSFGKRQRPGSRGGVLPQSQCCSWPACWKSLVRQG